MKRKMIAGEKRTQTTWIRTREEKTDENNSIRLTEQSKRSGKQILRIKQPEGKTTCSIML